MKKYLTSVATVYKYMQAIQGSIAEISDEEFFQILMSWPDFLQSSIAIERICHWQRELNGRNDDLSSIAEKKLKRIGIVLARKRRRTMIAIENKENLIKLRCSTFNIIKKSRISQYRDCSIKENKLKELFTPEAINKLLNEWGELPEHNAELADMITSVVSGYSPDTVSKYIKGSAKSSSK